MNKKIGPDKFLIDELILNYQNQNYKKTKILAEKIVKSFPNYFFAWKILGFLLFKENKLDQSIGFLKTAIKINSTDHEIYNILGKANLLLGNLNEAEANFFTATSLNYNYFDAQFNLAMTNAKLGKFHEAEVVYKIAIELNSNHAQAHYNLGNVYVKLKNYEKAEKLYKKAIEIKSDYTLAFNNLGFIYWLSGKFEESEKNYKKAISLDPNYIEAYCNLGVTLQYMHKFDEAELNYKKAININPNYPEAYSNWALTLMYKGSYKESFELSEWRWKTKNNKNKIFKSDKPLWNNQSNQTIYVWREQGIGDEIMFCSMINELIEEKSAKVILNCDQRLVPLFKRSLHKDITYKNDKTFISENDYDCHIPIASLANFFRFDATQFQKTSKGHLKHDKEKTNQINSILVKDNKTKIIGISWKTTSIKELAKFRNIPLMELVEKISKPNIKFINIQYGDTEEEILKVKEKMNIDIFTFKEIDNFNDLDSLASLMALCDKIVTIDNSTAQLAGSLGLDTGLLLSSAPDVRWGYQGSSCLWYESIKIYRQKKLGEWSDPLEHLEQDLANLF
jgi:tetratricopeptide (TPR) repeat protein